MEHIHGFGTITNANEVTVKKPDGSSQAVATKHILIATGSEVSPFQGIEVTKYYNLYKGAYMDRSCHSFTYVYITGS